MQGKTEQESTTGKNLFDANGIDSTRHILGDLSGFSDVDVSSYNLSNIIPVKEGESIVKSGTTGSSVVGFLGEDKSFLKGISLTDGKPVTVPAGAFYFCCNIALENIKNKIQIEKGNVATDYEPYTGGKPSPSVKYPQEIKSAGKYDETSGKYLINIKVTGKNLLNPESKADVSGLYKGWFIDTKDNFITASVADKGNGVDIGSAHFGITGNGINAHNGVAWLVNGTGVIRNKKITTQNKYFTIFNTTMKTITDRFYVQVEAGKKMTEYEPFKLQTLTIPLDRPLTKWDRLEKRDSIWGIARQSNKKILDGTEEWEIYGNKVHTFSCSSSTTIIDGFCTHYKNIGSDEIGTKTGVYLQYTSSIIITDLKIDNAEEFKAWLAQQKETGTPVELVYKTQTETWEQLPEETQIALNSLHTNYPTTIISNSEDTEMQLTYVADTKHYIDKKFEELNQAIVKTQIALL